MLKFTWDSDSRFDNYHLALCVRGVFAVTRYCHAIYKIAVTLVVFFFFFNVFSDCTGRECRCKNNDRREINTSTSLTRIVKLKNNDFSASNMINTAALMTVIGTYIRFRIASYILRFKFIFFITFRDFDIISTFHIYILRSDLHRYWVNLSIFVGT